MMSDKQPGNTSETLAAINGQAARRDFIRKSGRVAIAAPAAVLLLSAAGKSTVAQAASGGFVNPPDFANPKSNKNILDP